MTSLVPRTWWRRRPRRATGTVTFTPHITAGAAELYEAASATAYTWHLHWQRQLGRAFIRNLIRDWEREIGIGPEPEAHSVSTAMATANRDGHMRWDDDTSKGPAR